LETLEQGASDSSGTARRLLILAVLYAIPAVVLMRPVIDHDIWWHLKTGETVVAQHDVPRHDPFSTYGHDKPWVAYSWLFEVLVYGVYWIGGLTGLLVFRLVAAAAVLFSVHHLVLKREPGFVRATFLTGLAFLSLVPLLNERPWLFTMLFLVWTLEAILRLREGTATRAVWLLPAVFAVWANVHIQFVYGLALLGLACVAPMADALLGRTVSGTGADTLGTQPWRRLLALTALCAACTLLNPYGVRLYVVVWEYATQPLPFNVVNELMAPTFRLPTEWVFLGLAGAAAFALGRRVRPSLFDLLLLACTAFAAFRARRDLWCLVVASLAVLTGGPRPAPGEVVRFALSRGRVAALVVMVALFLLVVGWYRNLSEERLRDAVAQAFPVAAAEHVREHRPRYPGPLFNDFDWGGYLIWALPDYPVSMDGRTNLHGDERIAQHLNTIHGVRWERDPDLTNARLFVVERDSGLAAVLRLRPQRFQLVYEDPEDPKDEKKTLAAVFIACEDQPCESLP